MLAIVLALLRNLFSWLRPKHELAMENLALRHQIVRLPQQHTIAERHRLLTANGPFATAPVRLALESSSQDPRSNIVLWIL